MSSLTAVLPMPIAMSVSPDGRVVCAVAIASIVSTLFFALGPAWRLSAPNLTMTLKESAPLASRQRRRIAMPALLVGAQIALSVALLISAGVFLRASVTAVSMDPGFPLSGGLIAEVDPTMIGQDDVRGRTTYAALLEHIRSTAHVSSASVASMVPFGLTQYSRQVDANGVSTSAGFTVVGADYFTTLGLVVIAGREFTVAEENAATDAVAIVDQVLVDRLFKGGSPLGQTVRLIARDRPDELAHVVGVVATVRDDVLQPPAAHIYVPFGSHYQGEMTIHVRTAPGAEAAMLEPLRAAIQSVDTRLPILSLKTMSDHRDATPSLWAVTFAARLFVAFGVIAGVLATAGVYGLRAYLATQRRREIGIRIALGATRADVISQLLKEGAWNAAGGLIVGTGLAVGLTQLLRQSEMLYQVQAFDPIVFTVAPLVLAVAAAAASYVPARRALRVEPTVALRPE